jgi:hypothetical protein
MTLAINIYHREADKQSQKGPREKLKTGSVYKAAWHHGNPTVPQAKCGPASPGQGLVNLMENPVRLLRGSRSDSVYI